MKTIKLLGTTSGDWYILLLNGKVHYEGHSIPDFVYLGLLKDFGCDVEHSEITDQDAIDGTYER